MVLEIGTMDKVSLKRFGVFLIPGRRIHVQSMRLSQNSVKERYHQDEPPERYKGGSLMKTGVPHYIHD